MKSMPLVFYHLGERERAFSFTHENKDITDAQMFETRLSQKRAFIPSSNTDASRLTCWIGPLESPADISLTGCIRVSLMSASPSDCSQHEKISIVTTQGETRQTARGV